MSLDPKRSAELPHRPNLLVVLAAIMKGGTTVSQIAASTGMPMNSVARRVAALRAMGVVRVQRTEPRAGRAIRHYEATADHFFLPYDHGGQATPEDIIERTALARAKAHVAALLAVGAMTAERHAAHAWGTVIYLDRNGSLVVRQDFEGGRTPELLSENSLAYLDIATDGLKLDLADAKKLQRELVDLLKRYKSKAGRRRFSLSIVLTPSLLS